VCFGQQKSRICVGYMNNAGAWPEHHCKAADGALLNETIPKEEDGSYSKCKMYDADDRNKTIKCDQWEYFGNTGYTIVSEVTEFVSTVQHILIICYSKLSSFSHLSTSPLPVTVILRFVPMHMSYCGSFFLPQPRRLLC